MAFPIRATQSNRGRPNDGYPQVEARVSSKAKSSTSKQSQTQPLEKGITPAVNSGVNAEWLAGYETAESCKPASPRTVHWLAPCIARWFAQRRARRGNAYSVGYAGLVCFCEAWSLRGIVHSRSAFCLSRQRHGAGMNQVRLHRHATADVCGSCAPTKKPCRTKPRHRLFHCHTPP